MSAKRRFPTADRIVLDSGALTAVAQGSPPLRVALREATAHDADVVVPTIVIAESTTGRPSDANINAALEDMVVADLDLQIARHAAALRFRTKGSTLADAVVVATADTLGSCVIYTGDSNDIGALAAVHNRSQVLPIVPAPPPARRR